jgi:hypothetical protein
VWKQVLDEDSAPGADPGSQEVEMWHSLLHAIKFPGNKKGDWTEVARMRRRINWHCWSDNISEFEFHRYYRMELETFPLLCQNLAQQVEGDAVQGRLGSQHGAMSVEHKVLMTLRWPVI